MKQNLQKLQYKFTKFFHTHEAFVVLTLVLVALMAVVLRINYLNNLPADEDYYNQSVSDIKPVTFNQEAIEKIEQLRDSNVDDPGTQLPQDRNNPFTE